MLSESEYGALHEIEKIIQSRLQYHDAEGKRKDRVCPICWVSGITHVVYTSDECASGRDTGGLQHDDGERDRARDRMERVDARRESWTNL